MGRAFEYRKATKMKRWGNMARVFTKLGKAIEMSVKEGGPDPGGNTRLRVLIQNAKAENMPKDNIERAIKKGIGGGEGAANYEEITYEGYGPGGVAVLVEIMTDNKNRTVAEIRHIFSKHGGNLGENGCVAWMFAKKGSIVVDKKVIDEDALMELALEAGAEDVKNEDGEYEVITDPASFESIKKVLDAKGIKHLEARISMIPSNTVKLGANKAEQMLKMMEKLEDNDDVQNVYANFDIDEDVMEKLG